MTLTEFLEARIAEDEAVARAAADVVASPWRWGDVFMWGGGREYGLLGRNPYQETGQREVFLVKGRGDTHPDKDTAAHIVRWDPARVLAECAAKRAILTLHGERRSLPDDYPLCRTCDSSGPDAQGFPCDTIRALATVYADHPDYREEWREPR